jgi:hypothetical protein
MDFCTFCDNYGLFYPFWYVDPRKSGNPGLAIIQKNPSE